jgi:signal transduction histidine kinase
MAVRLAILITVVTGVSYWHMVGALENLTRESLSKYTRERGQREESIFRLAADNHRVLVDDFLASYRRARREPAPRLAALAKRNADGHWRSPRSRDVNRAGIFVQARARMTEDLRRRIATAREVTERLGPAFHTRFQDTYFSLPEGGVVVYWPQSPEWVQDIKEDYRIESEEWFSAPLARNNPEHRTVWTGAFLDSVSNEWMVTVATPVIDRGEVIASVHHDLMLDEILRRTIDDRLDGSFNYLMRSDGQRIAGPRTQQGQPPSLALRELLPKLRGLQAPDAFLETPGWSGDWVSLYRISGPDWYFVAVYPKAIVRASAMKSAATVLLLGVISLFLELVMVWWMLRRVDDRDRDLARLVEARTAELERARARNVQAAKMSALGEMAGGIAHEINNPVAIITAKSAQMRDQIDRGALSDEQIKHGLTRIENTAMRVAEIVRGLRTFSRTGDQDPLLRTRLRAVVEETLSFCREKLRNDGIELLIDVDDLEVDCRATQISQVLLNLIVNSQDAVRELSEKWILIEVKRHGDTARVRVTDSGQGIAPQVIDKLMTPFFTTKDIGKGTGLGLSISRGIIEDHRGQLYYDGEFARTTFVFELPTRIQA